MYVIYNLFVRPSDMTFGWTKGGILRYVIMHNVLWANQKTESSVYCWLRAHAMFDQKQLIYCGASDVILSVLLIC